MVIKTVVVTYGAFYSRPSNFSSYQRTCLETEIVVQIVAIVDNCRVESVCMFYNNVVNSW